jgi:hypothetical protein
LDPLDDLESSFHLVDDAEVPQEEDLHIATSFAVDEKAGTKIMDLLSEERYQDSSLCVHCVDKLTRGQERIIKQLESEIAHYEKVLQDGKLKQVPLLDEAKVQVKMKEFAYQERTLREKIDTMMKRRGEALSKIDDFVEQKNELDQLNDQ